MSEQPTTMAPKQDQELSGADSRLRNYLMILGLDIQADRRSEVISALVKLGSTIEQMSFVEGLRMVPRGSLDESKGIGLVGFTSRFFFGESRPGRDLLVNAVRFGLNCAAPACLKTPRIAGDDHTNGPSGVEASKHPEPDLLLTFEADTSSALIELNRSLDRLSEFKSRFFEIGFRSSSGRNGLGYHEGLSNLEDVRLADHGKYLGYIMASRESDCRNNYSAGTYLVYRKYRYNLEKWMSDKFTVKTTEGLTLTGELARDAVVGRQKTTGTFVDARGYPVDGKDAALKLPPFAHARRANPRQTAMTLFGDTVHPRDVRILRRGAEYETNEQVSGMLFLCFQSDIQHRGFEFINNHWLMSAGFMGCRDHLLSPESGLIVPLGGCYSFVPPVQPFPGALFFGTDLS